MDNWLKQHEPAEVHLWMPLLVSGEERMRSLRNTAIVVEAWLQWAERLGRKDVLLWAASEAIDLIRDRRGVGGVALHLESWAGLSAPEKAAAAVARMAMTRGTAFLVSGKIEVALRSFRTARRSSEAAEDLVGRADAWRGEADVLSRRGDNEGALAAYRTARRDFEAFGSPHGIAGTWLGEATVLLRSGDAAAALAAYQAAGRSFAALGSQHGEATALWGAATVAQMRGDTERALRGYRSARELFAAVGDPIGQGNTWLGEAQVLAILTENAAALAAYRLARRFFQDAGEPLGVANTFCGEADVLLLMGDHDAALANYREAAELSLAADDPLGRANAELGMAGVFFRHGDYAKALETFRGARELYRAAGHLLGEGNALRGEADIFLLWGDPELALKGYREARAAFDAIGFPLGQGNAWRGAADVFYGLEEYARALESYREARRLFSSIGHRLGESNAWLGEADVLARTRENDSALEAYRAARRMYADLGEPLGQGAAWRGEAEIHLETGRLADAAAAAQRAAALADPQKETDNDIRAWLIEAEARFRLGEMEQAARLAAQALDGFDDSRSSFLTDFQRTKREGLIQPAYEILTSALWQLNQRLPALERAEQARSRVLLDLVATRHAERGRGAEASDSSGRREELARELATIAKDLAGEPDPEKRRELEARRDHLDRQMERLGLEILFSADSPLATGRALDLTGIQRTVEQVGPTLLFHVAEDRTFVFLLRKGSEPVAEALPLGRAELDRRARRLVEDLANPVYESRAGEKLRELWASLIGPLADRLPAAGPLTLALHGPLHQIPFEALIDRNGDMLFERFDVAVTPSISTLHHVRNHHRPSRNDDVLLALAAGDGLNSPAVEVREIASIFDASRPDRFEPTVARYQTYETLAPRARHLFIASQAAYERGSRRLTYLQIEPSELHDGRLTAAEVASLPLDAELVTLAACDTAYAEVLLSDERLDLTRAFLAAGAAAVLASRWKVPEDDRTSRFLVDFYRAYRQGGPDGKGMRKDQALTEARRRSRKRADPARLWAAWVLVGDAR